MAARELQNILNKHDIELEREEMDDLMLQLAGWATSNFGGGGGGTGGKKVSSRKGKPTGKVTWWNMMLKVGGKDGVVPDFGVEFDEDVYERLRRSKVEKERLGARLVAGLIREGQIELGEHYNYKEVAEVCQAFSEQIEGKKLKMPVIHSAFRPFITAEAIDQLKEIAKVETAKAQAKMKGRSVSVESEAESEAEVKPKKRVFSVKKRAEVPKVDFESD